MKEIKTIGVLTSGGDAPGMNAAIRAVTRAAIYNGWKVMGVYRGYEGLINGDFKELTTESVSNTIQRGGTILKTARSEEFMTVEGRKKAYDNLVKFGVDALIVIGGNGSLAGAQDFAREYDIPIIGLPGTIDNDLYGTDSTIGYDTALDYTHIDSDKNREATRNTVVENNVFFLNRMGDLSIPGGGNFINISSADFSDVEYIDSESGNTTVQDANIFKGKIDEAYLKGFLNASYTAEMQHNPNSAVNTFRSALGMNQIGTMTSKVTMYANRYNWEKALLIFGAMPGYGAQMPQ